ncbi:unnamed protein product [Arabis nemorensis]|uniref:Uncharacterized protein n=1 Tax=Arabis nemorensis TaxID=586526 RepID=A0A565C5L1_9BRAS|nr:unnamed protein product [Arabis nemorensis]
MVYGVNLSPQLAICKVEALMKLQWLHEAEKLEKWAEPVRDYESLSQALPCDIAKSLFQAQVALRLLRDDVEEVSLF